MTIPRSGEVAPQDSDTDSGICADSEQPSPRQLIEIPLIFSSNSNSDYLTPESYRYVRAVVEDTVICRFILNEKDSVHWSDFIVLKGVRKDTNCNPNQAQLVFYLNLHSVV